MPPAFLCVGAALWDVIGRTELPLPPGADVPGRVVRRPGGVALNVALALAVLGRPVALLAALGRDPAGDNLAGRIAAAGVDPAWLHRHDDPTDAYVAIEGAGGELQAAVADCAGLERVGAALLAPLSDPFPGTIVADGNLPAPVLDALLRHPGAAGPVALVHASPGKAARIAGALAVRPLGLYVNRREAEAVCGAAFADSRAAAAALQARGAAEAIVTDGPRPVTATTAAGSVTLAPPPVATRSLTGAGDVFVAAHLAARADGLDPAAALGAALTASARHISREDP